MKSDWDKLKDHYFSTVRRGGITPSSHELKRYAVKNGLSVTADEINSLKVTKKPTAVFRKFTRPKGFISSSILKPGAVFVDLANFKTFQNKEGKNVDWSGFNYGYVGFIAAADTLSGQLAAVPVKDKTQGEWARAIEILMTEHFPQARAIVSDRDSAVVKASFRKKIEEKYNVTWIFMKTMAKSAAAERAIRTLKSHLSMGLRARQESKTYKGRKRFNWVDMLEPFLDHFNSRKVKNTSIARKDVDKMNYVKVLNAKMGVADSTALQNARVLPPEMLGSGKNIRSVFRFEVGDSVILELGADFERTRSEKDSRRLKKNYFEKKSVKGSYSERPHKITERMLKSTSANALIPVYRLSGFGNVWFYQRQLARVHY